VTRTPLVTSTVLWQVKSKAFLRPQHTAAWPATAAAEEQGRVTRLPATPTTVSVATEKEAGDGVQRQEPT